MNSSSSVIQTLTLGLSAICGVLTRVSVDRLFGPQGADITSSTTALFFDLPANFLGCFIIAFYNEWNKALSFSPVITLAISTGYAGSVTTFASWNFQVIRMFARGHWLPALIAIVLGLSTSSFALLFGQDMGVLLVAFFRSKQFIHVPPSIQEATDDEERKTIDGTMQTTTSPAESNLNRSLLATRRVVILIFVFSSLLSGCIAGAVLDVDAPIRRGYWGSAALAPIGAVTRWKLSRLNARSSRFPIGTFTANIAAVVLDTAIGAAILVHTNTSTTARIFLDAIITGIGGALSTVSTWMVEIHSLSTAYRYLYIVSTIVTAQALGLLVYGTTFWAVT